MTRRALTTIVATVGPACRRPEQLLDLVRAGVDVFRLNMAHGSQRDHEATLEAIRQASSDAGRPVGVLVDLAGPKIRLGELAHDPVDCREGEIVRFVRGTTAEGPDELVVNYERLNDELVAGDRVMLADGTVTLQVVSAGNGALTCRVISGGVVRSRQGVNLPGAKLDIPAMTDADRDNAVWALGRGVDFIGLSFVRRADDVRLLRKLLDDHDAQPMIVAKIEKSEALDDLDAIVDAADAVMVARGDLGVEIEVSQTPLAQKRIIAAAQSYQKPVIVATQMLDSMQRSRRPTRAEVSDVANAILEGADACMLSGETAVGEYPREAVAMMNEIMLSAESLLDVSPETTSTPIPTYVHPITSAVVFGSGRIAGRLDAKLVVVVTSTGATARVKSKQRLPIPTIGLSDREATLRRMALFWGIRPVAGAPIDDLGELRRFVDDWGRREGLLDDGDRVVFVTGSNTGHHAHNLLVVHEVGR